MSGTKQKLKIDCRDVNYLKQYFSKKIPKPVCTYSSSKNNQWTDVCEEAGAMCKERGGAIILVSPRLLDVQ